MSEKTKLPRFLVSAPSSGSGKTLITCALLRILSDKGYRPCSYKCGPDYIDPMFHREVLSVPSSNLDIFLQQEEGVKKALIKGKEYGNTAVIEGVMGLYDGAGTSLSEGSSYSIAALTKTPVILVVDCRGMSRSVVSVIKGFAADDREKLIKGIILNNISPMVLEDTTRLIAENTGIPVLGSLPKMQDIDISSRHLGLVLPGEIDGLLETIDRVCDKLCESLDIALLTEVAESAPDIITPDELKNTDKDRSYCKNKKVAVAMDEAFCFYYRDNLEFIKKLGADIVYFSPIHDKSLPPADCYIFGGGYPELYAKELSENKKMLEDVKSACERNDPVLAECGGYLYLKESIRDPEGHEMKMAGVFKGASQMNKSLTHFGYVNVTSLLYNPYLKKGETIKAHEFHYYRCDNEGEVCLMEKPGKKRSWQGGEIKGNTFAGFAHLYYPSCPEFIKRFLNAGN